MSILGNTSPQESRTGKASKQTCSKSELTSPRNGTASESSNWRRKFNNSEIPPHSPILWTISGSKAAFILRLGPESV